MAQLVHFIKREDRSRLWIALAEGGCPPRFIEEREISLMAQVTRELFSRRGSPRHVLLHEREEQLPEQDLSPKILLLLLLVLEREEAPSFCLESGDPVRAFSCFWITFAGGVVSGACIAVSSQDGLLQGRT